MNPVLSYAAAPKPRYPGTETVLVTLNVFSGRPDPSWQLSPRQAEELRRHLSTLEHHVADVSPTPAPLGYRGFTLSGGLNEPYQPSITVAHGVVRAANDRLLGIDPRHTIEHWLLETAGSSLDENLKATVRTQLDRNTP